ncbi:hypothetical protein HOL82_03610 [Candidatus Woesearchaeota archaeon]|nr:hypothetical protein [Candidatus Woesearchaeota archaeon]
MINLQRPINKFLLWPLIKTILFSTFIFLFAIEMEWIPYTSDEFLTEIWIHLRNLSNLFILGLYVLILIFEPLQALYFSSKKNTQFSKLIFTSIPAKKKSTNLKMHYFLSLFLGWLLLSVLSNFTFIIAKSVSDFIAVLVHIG